MESRKCIVVHYYKKRQQNCEETVKISTWFYLFLKKPPDFQNLKVKSFAHFRFVATPGAMNEDSSIHGNAIRRRSFPVKKMTAGKKCQPSA